MHRHGGWDAEAETGPEAGNPAAWGGEPGRDRRLAREVSGVLEEWGGRFSDSQIFRKRTFESRAVNG